MANITQDRVRELLTYDKDTGVLTNRIKRNSRARAGDVAGHLNNVGYLNIWLDGSCYLAHRLAWLYVTGEWPTMIDHKDRNRSNNAWNNLRSCSGSQNCANKKTMSRYGYKGVCRTGANSWQAQLKSKGRRYVIGGFSTPQEAHEAYMNLAVKVYGEFAGA